MFSRQVDGDATAPFSWLAWAPCLLVSEIRSVSKLGEMEVKTMSDPKKLIAEKP